MEILVGIVVFRCYNVEVELSLSWKEIKEVLEAPSIPNYEEAIQVTIRKLLEGTVEVRSQSQMALVEFNKNGAPFVLLGAHSDVLGGRVTDITDDGFIRFTTTGTAHSGWLIGQKVRIHTELSGKAEVLGVIGHKAVHHMEKEEFLKSPKVSELVIDVGAKKRKEVQKLGVEIGDPVIYSISAEKLPLNNRVVSRGFDNRAGVLTLLEAIRRMSKDKVKPRLVFAFWGGEEVGLIGGFRGSALYKPEIMINVDVGFATRTPATDKEKSIHGSVDLGEGVIINRGAVFDPGLVRLAFETAKKSKIKTQFSVTSREPGTDATPFNRSGARVLDLGIPCRYMHHDEVVDLADIDSAASLVVKIIKNF